MAKNEAKIKFTAETGEFNNAIKKSNDEMSELRAELKLNETQMKSTGTSVDGLKKKHNILEKQLAASQSKTEALSAKVDKASQIYGENSSEVTKLKTQLANAQTAEEKIRQEIDKCNKELKEQESAANKAGKSAEGLNDKMKKLAIGIGAAGAALIAFGKNAIDAFNEVDEGADNVIKATGATGKVAEELEQSYKNVASTMVGDFGNIGSTLGEVNTRFGYTGKQAEETTERFLKFSEVTGMDSVSAVQAVSRAIESAGLPAYEYRSILDSLTKAGQVTGVSVDTLATSLTDNGAVMREMGIDTQTSIAMLAQFEKAGVDSNSVVRGMRTGLAKWSKDGKDAKTEFANLVNGIKNGSVDAGEAYEVFGAKAGAELVDAIKSGRFEYEDMVAVINNSKGTLDDTFDATVDGGYELELAMQNAKMALAEAGEEIGTALTPALQFFSENILPAATKAIGAMVDGISSAVKWMKEHKGATIAIATVIGVLTTAIGAYIIVQKINDLMKAKEVTTVWALVAAYWAKAAATMAAIAPYVLMVAAIAAVIAIIVVCVKHWDKIVAAVKKCWEVVKATLSKWGSWINTNVIQPIGKFFSNLWNGIKNGVANVGQWFKDKFTAAKNGVQNAWSGVKNFFANIWNGIKSAFSAVGSWFKDKFNSAKQGVQNAWSGITNFFGNIYSKIKSTFSKVKDAILSPFKTAINKVKGLFNSLKLKFPNIKLPHFSVKPKGWKIGDLLKGSIPKLGIEWYAKAMKSPTILNGATIFGQANGRLLGGGETGSEMIGGTNTVMQMIQSAVDRSMQSMNINALAAAVADLASRPIELDINGRQFALATAGDSDRVNGMRNRIIERGVLLD